VHDRLLSILMADEPPLRDRSLREACEGASTSDLLTSCAVLERTWRDEPNLYRRVRTLLFLAALQRLHLPATGGLPNSGAIPAEAVEHLMQRRFEQSIDCTLAAQAEHGPSEALGSALAAAYRELAFDTLAKQVRTSVRSVTGNRWMFELTDTRAHPLKVVPELIAGACLLESTPVRMDFSHSAWSDIFFLAMDAPEAARVLNVSIDLSVHGRDEGPRPPIDVRLSVIDEPCLRLTSVDLHTSTDLTSLAAVFDFAADHLGLLRAGLVASGIVPPGLEDGGGSLSDLLTRLVGTGRGLHLLTHVHGIPKGSRLAVSTNLLGSIIAAGMRATGQTEALTGPLTEQERDLICARAILGEWLGGSGGGWQDSGGLWPGFKLISGAAAQAGDPEWGVSRGRLLPTHRLLGSDDCPDDMAERLAGSLVLAHGGMAQDVGPVLELVTEKYLLREPTPTLARREAGELFDRIAAAVRAGDVAAIGRATHENFHGPLQRIIPWAGNAYTDTVVSALSNRFGNLFWGFWMLGGMSGGGMGFLFDPAVKNEGRDATLQVLTETAMARQHQQPFAMAPVVYDFAVNARGSWAQLDGERSSPSEPVAMPLPVSAPQASLHADEHESLDEVLHNLGFDRNAHDELRQALRSDSIGLARNRLPADASVTDVQPGDVTPSSDVSEDHRRRGAAALARGEVAVVTLAGGLGTRWTRGAGVVKALNPFWPRDGVWRSFLDVHAAKCRRTERFATVAPLHVITTSWLTHQPIADWCARVGSETSTITSPGRGVGLRMVPTVRDLHYLWNETGRQLLDDRAERVGDSLRSALLAWASEKGEASDYRDNRPDQCLHPLGHGYELASLVLNGTLRRMLAMRPGLQTLLLHNVDTLGADLDEGLLGLHLERGPGLTFEVVPRRIEDRGGGLARVDGKLRLIESIALPDERIEWRLTWYNSLTTWIDIDHWLGAMGLKRDGLDDDQAVADAVGHFVHRLPVYVTLKDVKQRWGHGHEDVFPVSQWERLWGDVTTLPELSCRYVGVPLFRGRQLKDPAQLDTWLQDGSASHVASLCDWPDAAD
jgi:hypothetical protein